MLMHEDKCLRSHRILYVAEQGHTMHSDVHTDGEVHAMDMCSATLGHAQGIRDCICPCMRPGSYRTWGCAHRGTRPPRCYTRTPGLCGMLHQDMHAGTQGHVHGALAVRAQCYTATRLPHTDMQPGPLWIRLLLAPQVPVPPGEAGRGARRGFRIGCRGCQRGGVTGPGWDWRGGERQAGLLALYCTVPHRNVPHRAASRPTGRTEPSRAVLYCTVLCRRQRGAAARRMRRRRRHCR